MEPIVIVIGLVTFFFFFMLNTHILKLFGVSIIVHKNV